MDKPKVFTLSYELRSGSADGQVIETAGKDKPAEFLFGMGNLVKEFEENIKSLSQGDEFSFTIQADNAYGQSDEKAVIDVPKDIFVIDGKLAEELLVVGKVVPMKDKQGNPLYGTIKEIAEETVKMDFNHPLAGHDLHFSGSVVDTRDASEEEVKQGHPHRGEEN